MEKYDKEHKISVVGEKDKYTMLQWLFFQASGQGYALVPSCSRNIFNGKADFRSSSPYYGQVFWFKNSHPERVPSTVERYQNEILRVFGVLDGVLAKQPSGWLVGGKLTIADLSFIMWDLLATTMALSDRTDVDVEKTYPAFYA